MTISAILPAAYSNSALRGVSLLRLAIALRGGRDTHGLGRFLPNSAPASVLGAGVLFAVEMASYESPSGAVPPRTPIVADALSHAVPRVAPAWAFSLANWGSRAGRIAYPRGGLLPPIETHAAPAVALAGAGAPFSIPRM